MNLDSKETSKKTSPKTPKKQPDEKVQKEILEQLRSVKKASQNQNSIRVMSVRLNPIYILVGGILLFILIMGFVRSQDSSAVDISTNEFVANLKDDSYSTIQFRDSGTVVADFKSVDRATTGENQALEEVEGVEVKNEDKVDTVELGELVQKLNPSVTEIVRGLYNEVDSTSVAALIIGQDYILADITGVNVNDLLVQATSKSDLEAELQQQGSGLDQLNIEIFELTSDAKTTPVEELRSNIGSNIYSKVWSVGGNDIAVINSDNRVSQSVDLSSVSPNYLQFLEFLQNEGIEIEANNVRIENVNTSSIDWGLIINLLSLGIIGFLVFSVIRGLNGGSKGLMQFGQSKAKMFFGKKPEVTFKDVAGVDNAKDELNEVVLFLKDPKRFLKLGARIPKGLLMVGPPGTGKTLLARAIAGEAGVPFFHTSGSEFEEMLVGAGASRVRDLFAKAKKASPALIFIDEIDAVARKRGTTVQSSSTEQTLNQILVEMDGFEKNSNVIVIAATNRPDVLDPAILRPGRFDRRIVVELPDIKGREQILSIHAKNKPFAADVDLKTVARRTVGYSGADLENVLNEAAIIVAKDGRKEIGAKDIEEAANRTTMGRARKIERTEEEVEKTAFHEAGHAIVAKLTPKSDPVHRITIVSRGMALGVTMQLPERDKYSQSYTEMESRLRVLMGGRAAEELIYGQEMITSGASNDIEKATQMARRMVKSFGYSDKLGLVKYGQSNELQYLGYGYGEQTDYSPATAELIDAEVKRIIDEAYKDALTILKTNAQLLEKISRDLIEMEVMEGDEFDKYFDGMNVPE